MMTSSPLQLHKANPTHEKADDAVKALRERAARVDANDMLYQYDCSTDYNPSPQLENDPGAAVCGEFGGRRGESAGTGYPGARNPEGRQQGGTF